MKNLKTWIGALAIIFFLTTPFNCAFAENTATDSNTNLKLAQGWHGGGWHGGGHGVGQGFYHGGGGAGVYVGRGHYWNRGYHRGWYGPYHRFHHRHCWRFRYYRHHRWHYGWRCRPW